ncbi:hypothetical protein QKV95_gp077 [Poseidoniales virus YSH_150918]|uniref:Uncharacterized protein n=1 Tax=Poseidoniales virus YSH_150918 TaxID=3071324 RepID=A0A976UAZ8_9CAUD|nr:hypothetical protein QKV95_gp077 [Yangshan Harbor Poseidoniales virus]UVF62554.1 hypothetical protein [Poseidoniales virus YSH_150918]
MTDYVYLKTQKHDSGDGLTVNTIPLRVVSVGVSVSKTIPAFPIPMSGVATGESITAALDLGMAQKTISLEGFISGISITKELGGTNKTVEFTAQEVAQLIASGVDSTGFAKNQAVNELVVLIPSNVDSSYVDRDSGGIGSRGDLIPLTFHSRGLADTDDNEGVPSPLGNFPDSSTDEGLTGFIRSFSFQLSGEAVDISFSMEFEVANIVP